MCVVDEWWSVCSGCVYDGMQDGSVAVDIDIDDVDDVDDVDDDVTSSRRHVVQHHVKLSEFTALRNLLIFHHQTPH